MSNLHRYFLLLFAAAIAAVAAGTGTPQVAKVRTSPATVEMPTGRG
jgi:hypothetical protein